MVTRLEFAKFIHFGYWTTFIIAASVVYFDIGGVYGTIAAFSIFFPFVIFIFYLRCRNCGVSYFFDPEISSWNISGANLMKSVQPQCPKCGADGDRR